MDSSQVKDIKIPQGQVKYIAKYEKGTTGPCYWKRPFTYPAIGFYLYCNFIPSVNGYSRHTYISPQLIFDKYGMSSKLLPSLPSSQNTDGSINVYYALDNIRLPSETNEIDLNDYSSSFVWITKGLENKSLRLRACGITNDSDMNNFPKTSYTNSATKFTFSDERDKKIKLYASPVEDIQMNNAWSLKTIATTAFYREREYRERTHETDVIVTAGTPLITLSTGGLSWSPYISSVRNNFDEYKSKYDTATGSKFPKSSYPYLVGSVELQASTSSYDIHKQPLSSENGWSLMNFYFVIER